MKDSNQETMRDFFACIEDIINNPKVLEMKQFPHHGKYSCYDHCLHVAYYNYCWSLKLHLNAREAARGGMLHDLFLYDWHTHAKETGDRVHAVTHPKSAYENAKKLFTLSKIEADIITTHMWPVTLWAPPRTREGWLTIYTDKHCGAWETSKRGKRLTK